MQIVRKIIIITGLLALWQAAAMHVGLDLLLPSPASVLRALWRLCSHKEFYLTCFMSLGRVLMGFILGVALGAAGGALSTLSVWVRDAAEIVAAVFKAAPVASFIILALVWLQRGRVPVLASFLIVMPMVYTNVYTGIRQTDEKLIEMSRAFGVKGPDRIFRLYIPSVKPYFIAASTTAMGMAWKAGIAAEVIASPKHSIGSYMNGAKIYLNTPELFAWTLAAVALSLALERLIKAAAKRKGGAA